ncbi:methyltransferase [Nonomuraea sp. NPDC050643]|uniref:methyltransferase n=1 Tax=Nonomuraea sp. NPDC050643 TaxID=3155660 RepID=UPI0033C1B874
MTAHDHHAPALPTEGPNGATELHAERDAGVSIGPFAPAGLQALMTYEAIQQMTGADIRLKALKAFVDLGIADILADEFRTSDELTEHCQADPEKMGRYLYALHALDVLTIDADGRYGLTPIGRSLRPHSPLWATLGVITSPLWQRAGDSLAATICTGRPPVLNGDATPYPLLAADPPLAEKFDAFMSGRTAGLAAELAARGYAEVRTVADLGGGDGSMLAEILTAHPHLNGVLVERADVAARAERRLAEQGLAGRVQIITGDIVKDACPPADRIILSSVVHNLDDPTSGRLLGHARQALTEAGPHAQLWVVEVPLPEPGIYTSGTDLDLRMMALFAGGRERTRRQYRALLALAGLDLVHVVDLPGDHTLMIAMADSDD